MNDVKESWILDLGCEVRSVEKILKAIPGFSNDATSIELCYENPIERKSLIVGEAFYSQEEGRTIFVHTKFVKNGNQKSAFF